MLENSRHSDLLLVHEADTHNLKLLEQFPVTETERKALEGIEKPAEVDWADDITTRVINLAAAIYRS